MSDFIKRRNFLAGVAGVGIGAAALCSRVNATNKILKKTDVSSKPNIVFILADDMGFADVSCFGDPGYTTPAIDRIANEGVRMTRAYANSAVCSATRTALITGQYQDRFECGLEEPINNDSIGIPPGIPTLPAQLKKAGYRTALVGKWHLGGPPSFGPLKSGYDHFYGIAGGAADYFTHQQVIGEDQFYRDDKLIHEHGYMTTLLGKETARLIDQYSKESSPFFISLHFTAPHWPWEGPNDQAESTRLQKAGKGIFDYDGGTQKTYGLIVQAMDQEIDRVLKALDRHHLAENTIVVFTSDNGGERFSDVWPFTGRKNELLEGGIRVPAVFRWPAQICAGSETTQSNMTMDWLPTFLSAAGAIPDSSLPPDGIDLLPFLRNTSKHIERSLSWRYNKQTQRAQIKGNYKYLQIAGNEYLFNVVEDPRERANLKNRQPQLFAQLKQDWENWNEKMLPYTDKNFSGGPVGSNTPDRYGVK